LIQRLLCRNSDKYEPCQQCHSCHLLAAGSHPDFHHISNEKEKMAIGIDAVRQMMNSVYERAQQGQNKVIWIENADLLTEAAANALLKTIEEPPPHSYFILSCSQAAKLLPTIRSRCFYFQLAQLHFSEALAWLSDADQGKHTQEALITALKLSANAPLSSLTLLSDEV